MVTMEMTDLKDLQKDKLKIFQMCREPKHKSASSPVILGFWEMGMMVEILQQVLYFSLLSKTNMLPSFDRRS